MKLRCNKRKETQDVPRHALYARTHFIFTSHDRNPMHIIPTPTTNPSHMLLFPLAPELLFSADGAFADVVELLLEELFGAAGVDDAGAGASNSSGGSKTLSTWYTASGDCWYSALLIGVSTMPVETLTWLPWLLKLRPAKLPCVLTGLLTLWKDRRL